MRIRFKIVTFLSFHMFKRRPSWNLAVCGSENLERQRNVESGSAHFDGERKMNTKRCNVTLSIFKLVAEG